MSSDLTPSNEVLIQLEVKLDRLCNGIDHLRDKQEEMAEDIAKIKVNKKNILPYLKNNRT